MPMNPVVHFEMPALDRKRMSDFYARVFGWKTQQLGPEMGDYVLVQTGETDNEGMPLKPGFINGGFYQKMESAPHPSIVVAVDDIEMQMKNVEKAGGKVLPGMTPGKPDEIPSVGLFVSIVDTEGNRVGMLQPSPEMTPGKKF